jgi:outer membrane autotransporter protein
VFSKAFRTIGSVVGLAVLSAAVSAPARSQTLTTLPGETALQQTVGAAVAAMCKLLKPLAAPTPAAAGTDPPALNDQQLDLFHQCHALVGAAKLGPDAAVLPGALQQVSGNEISTQGALATRVVSGQFANISGRLNALRFGSNVSIAQGHATALNDDPGAGGPALSSVGPQMGYVDSSLLQSGSQADGFAPTLDAPARGLQASAPSLINAGFTPDGSIRVAQAASSSASEPSSADASAGPLLRPTNPWGWFVEGSYNFGHHDLTSNEDPFDFHASSVTTGVDYNFGAAVLGASIGYDDYDAGFRPAGTLVSGGGAEVKGTSGSLYGAWFGQHWTFNGIATYGKLTTDVDRIVSYTLPDSACGGGANCTVNRSLDGDPDGHYVAAGATAGYQFTTADAWDLSPSVSLSYRRASIASFAETDPNPPAGGDGLALYYDGQTVDSMRSIVGLDLSRSFSRSFGILTPTLRVEWDHEFKNEPRTIEARYAADTLAIDKHCVSCFALPTDPATSNFGIAGAGVSVLLTHRVQAYVYYEDLFGVANYRSESVAIGLRAQF